MKILILFIYSDSDTYKKMMILQRKYIHNFEEVDSFFVQMRENQENNIEIEGDMIFVKGTEAYLNILYKTIQSIEYLFSKKKYNFLIRTNISTIVNIPQLLIKLNTFPSKNMYSGSLSKKLCWLDINGGITDSKLWGTEFIVGISIILSFDLVNFLIENKDKLDYNIIDDVSLGYFIKNYSPESLEIGKKYLVNHIFSNNDNMKQIELDYNSYIIFRNKNNDRNDDLKTMNKVCQLIYKTNE
uniref:Uncharacterized protein n=1 Tax=viral metagenome TaxID=1070528 RepID=A0A6C0D9Z7_9ZZZZ